MVGVASSNLVAPTKFGRKNKHLAETPGAFLLPVRINCEYPPSKSVDLSLTQRADSERL